MHSSKARRNLFGYFESKAVYQLLDKEVSNMAEKSQKEWNFDFVKESPRTGRYRWQKVPHCDVPFWYTAISRKGISYKIPDNFLTQKESKCKENDISKKSKFVQTSIKDYTRVKKRRSSSRIRLKQLQLYSPRLRSNLTVTDGQRAQ